MANAKEIRAGLATAKKKRVDGKALVEQGTDELRKWLDEANENDDVSMAEAARLGGVSRVTAYEMLPERTS